MPVHLTPAPGLQVSQTLSQTILHLWNVGGKQSQTKPNQTINWSPFDPILTPLPNHDKLKPNHTIPNQGYEYVPNQNKTRPSDLKPFQVHAACGLLARSSHTWWNVDG